MSKYRFLKNNKISIEDVKRLITLTEKGVLRWQHSSAFALNAWPISQEANDDPVVSARIIGENLRGIRIGYNPETKLWRYLRLTDHNMNWHYVERDAPQELKNLVSRLYVIAILQVARQLDIPGAYNLYVNKKVFEIKEV